MKEKIIEIYQRLIKSYRLSVYDLKSLTEVFSRRFSPMVIILGLLSIFVFAIILTVLFIIYTPAKRALPGYPSKRMSEMIVYNSMMLDSLEKEIQKRDNFLEKIKNVISGEIINDSVPEKKYSSYQDIEIQPMNNDSIFEDLISPDKYKFSYSTTQEDASKIAGINFFPPMRGIIINKFNASPGHFGTDIVGQNRSPVRAILSGTVIFAEWSLMTGYVIQVQHDFNLVSVYKHNSEIVAKPGERVVTGQVISFMGSEGEYSTGPHLHFEMWHNGRPLDTEKYIDFN